MHEVQTAVRPHRAFKTAGVQSCLFGSVNHGVVRGSHLPNMAGASLAECAPADARILVLGAGGGLELKGFAEIQQYGTSMVWSPRLRGLSWPARPSAHD